VSVRGIGIDVVQISRMRQVISRWDERFLLRVFTDGEIAYCRARRDPVPHFAARFAAKEAGLKALGTGLRLGIQWRELEVVRERGQAPTLVLSGRSREIGRQRGGSRMLLALTHDGDYAMAHAMLVAETDSVPPGSSERPPGASERPAGGSERPRTLPSAPFRRA
jgi:holo-[acyl-carrier protein] synthase